MNTFDHMELDLPEGSVGRYHIRRFEVGPYDLGNLRLIRNGHGHRVIPPGTYTKLVVGNDPAQARLWMSDTPAEKRDHFAPVAMIEDLKAKRVLINGLGLGMVLKAALSFDHVERVDVVEIQKDIIELVGPHYDDPRVKIHHADAYRQTKFWPQGTRWDVGWSDIWMDLDTDDLKHHATMNRAYGQRCTWHECWAHDLLLSLRRTERREAAREAEFYG